MDADENTSRYCMRPPCSFSVQAGEGSWGQHTFAPRNCEVPPLRIAPLRQCLRNKTISFVGDSVMRELALAMASLLDTLGAENAESLNPSLGQPKFNGKCWSGSAQCAIRRALNGPTPINQTGSRGLAGVRGAWTQPALNVTVRSFNDAARAIHWHMPHGIRSIVHESRVANRAADEIIFVGLGIHDTNSAISELVGAKAALRWREEPSSWTHGPVFQPFLDHWCEAMREAASAAGHAAVGGSDAVAESPTPSACNAGHNRGEHLAGGQHLAGGEHLAGGQPATRQTAVLPYAPLVWMTANEQCAEKKPSKWRYQAKTMAAANRASVEAGLRFGVPVLDWSATTPHNHSAESRSDACRLSGDGVHVLHWVDHIRASILLTYLCDGEGRWRQPCVDPHKVTRHCEKSTSRAMSGAMSRAMSGETKQQASSARRSSQGSALRGGQANRRAFTNATSPAPAYQASAVNPAAGRRLLARGMASGRRLLAARGRANTACPPVRCDRDCTLWHCGQCRCAACSACDDTAGAEVPAALPPQPMLSPPLPPPPPPAECDAIDSRDTSVQDCQPWCAERSKSSHCMRCACFDCDFCERTCNGSNLQIKLWGRVTTPHPPALLSACSDLVDDLEL